MVTQHNPPDEQRSPGAQLTTRILEPDADDLATNRVKVEIAGPRDAVIEFIQRWPELASPAAPPDRSWASVSPVYDATMDRVEATLGRIKKRSTEPTPERRTPQVGDMVRVHTDPAYFGILGAISRVEWLTRDGHPHITVAGRGFSLDRSNVTVVTYDNETGTWNEVK